MLCRQSPYPVFHTAQRFRKEWVTVLQQESHLTFPRQSVLLIGYWCCILLGWPFLSGFGAPRVVDQIYTPSTQVVAGTADEWLALSTPPPLSATASLLYDVDADRVLFAENQNRALPVASLTKLMTALLVLEADDLQAEVVVQASDLVGGTSMQLVPGEVVTVENLLRGMLIPSGNDAAMALARHTAGSVEAFVQRMNERAVALQLSTTHFVNPHGLDAEGHVSSAHDLLAIVRLDWDFPLFREIVAMPQATVQGHVLRNTNELLGVYSGTNGIKTGTTDAAGQCLVAGFQQEGHQVIAIVLGSTDRYQDMRMLYEHYQAHYEWVVADAGQLSILNRLYDQNGKIWYFRTASVAPTYLLPVVAQEELVPYRRLQQITDQPWQSGMPIGTIEWHFGTQVIGTQQLVLW